eukprot:SAG31_NODE_29481_length_394_cov_1.400000_1_plen_20_part_10
MPAMGDVAPAVDAEEWHRWS